MLCHPSAHSDHPVVTGLQRHQHMGQRIPNTGMLVLPSTQQIQAHIQQGRCTLWPCCGVSACQKDTAAHPRGFSCPLELTCSSTNRVPTPPFLTLIFRRYYTLFGLRMSYLDSGGGKRELAGEQRNIKHVLVTSLNV